MENEKKKSKKWIIMLIIFLFIGVVVSTIVYLNKLKDYMPDDDGAIDIVEKDDTATNNNNSDGNSQSSGTDYTFVAKPGFEVNDDNGVWMSETDIEIFKISYENGNSEMTIMSDDGDKVIAPGSENSYTFKLRNLGNVPMDYTLDINAYVTPGEVTIPVEYRLSRHDGKWISGNTEEWVDTDAFNETVDEYDLGVNRFSWYTLDWRWLFENGQDELDTYLGNLAVDGDITLTIEIKTEATISEGYGNGHIVSTGDNNNTILYIALGGMSLIVFLLLFYKKDDEE